MFIAVFVSEFQISSIFIEFVTHFCCKYLDKDREMRFICDVATHGVNLKTSALMTYFLRSRILFW